MARLAIVTGGTRGIGAGIAARLRRDGYTVKITGKTANAEVERPDYISVDFTKQDELGEFLNHVSQLEPDIIVNNAGINIPSAFQQINVLDYEKMENINLRPPMLICRAALPGMVARRWGRIVNISSIWAVTVKEQRAPYCATKFGLVGMTTALAVEVAESGVLANCVAPGFIETEATRDAFTEDQLADAAKQIPIRRFGKPEEVASLVSWLVSEDNTYVTGQNILIDGALGAI